MKGKLTKKLMIAIGLSLATVAYPIAQVVAEPAGSLYRVRESANNPRSQIGAYRNLEYAKALASSNEGYEVYDENGALVFAPTFEKEEVETTTEVKETIEEKTTTKEAVETTVAKTIAKEETTKATTTATTMAESAESNGEEGTYTLNSSTARYVTAYNANKNSESVGNYPAGTYYIYKTSNGMINISKTKGVPGSWINPNGSTNTEKTVTKATTAAKTTTTPKATTAAKITTAANKATSATTTAPSINGTFKLEQNTLKYGTAYNASVNSSSLGTYEAGTYYVYKTVNGMVNVSKVPGVPGAWINPNGTKPSTSITTTTAKTSTATKSTTSTKASTQATNSGLSAAQQKIVSAVKGALGTPYVYGGESYAEGGFDCSGLAQYAYAQAGISIPRTSTSQLYGMTRVSTPQPGDLVIYAYDGDIVHTGIYVGNGQIIHAPDEGQVVSYHSVNFYTLDAVGYVRGY